MSRFTIHTESSGVPKKEPVTTSWDKIFLHDNHGVYEDQEFKDMQLLTKVVNALNGEKTC